jgi:hypothetical protein
MQGLCKQLRCNRTQQHWKGRNQHGKGAVAAYVLHTGQGSLVQIIVHPRVKSLKPCWQPSTDRRSKPSKTWCLHCAAAISVQHRSEKACDISHTASCQGLN